MAEAPPRGFAAVLFDLDGTLYRQGPLRRRMLGELARAPLAIGPRAALRVVRRLRAFRSAREELRGLGRAAEPLVELQYRVPAERLGEPPEALEATVEEWMFRRPLPFLAGCARPDLAPVLERLAGLGMHLGVFSDYPVEEKLVALGVRERFDLALCAVEPDVNAFKPHPRGFQLAAERWNLAPARVLYVGDRPEVDARGAQAAGMACVLVGARAAREPRGFTEVLRVVAR